MYFIIHQQAFREKTLSFSRNPVISTVNCIRLNAFKHSQFQGFLKKKNRSSSVPRLVQLLSHGKVLSRFLKLRNEIEIFLIKKN